MSGLGVKQYILLGFAINSTEGSDKVQLYILALTCFSQISAASAAHKI